MLVASSHSMIMTPRQLSEVNREESFPAVLEHTDSKRLCTVKTFQRKPLSLENLFGKFFFGVIFSPFSKSFTNQACLINASRYRPRSLSYN